MLVRIFIALAIIISLFLLLKFNRAGQLRAAQRSAASIVTENESQILYFSSAVCPQCLGQEKILNHILAGSEFQDIILKKYSVEEEKELAQQWGVKTLPTTILLSDSGVVQQINNGLISTGIMLSQLRKLNVNNVDSVLL